MDDMDMLASVLAKTSTLMDGVGDTKSTAPTPCPDLPVGALMRHMASWAQVFASAAEGEKFVGDPAAYQPSDGVAADFRAAADRIVDGWRANGLDRQVPMTGSDLPAPMVFNMTLMEYVTHGWDLAVATGCQVPFSDEEVEETLSRAQSTLPDQYRGDGQAFGPVVDAGEGADAMSRLAGFMGRKPDFQPV